MLSDICDDDRVALCELVELFDDHRACQPVFAVEKRVLGLHLGDLIHPLVVVLLLKLRVEVMQYFLEVSDDRLMHLDILVDLSGIDINVDDLGAGREFVGVSDHAVRETGAHRDQKVAFADSQIGSLGAVHADHACVVRIVSVKSALSHQCIADGGVDQIDKCLQLFAGSGDHGAAAHIEVGALGGLDHLDHAVDIGVAVTASLALESFGRGGCRDIFSDGACHVLGNIDKDRSGSSCRRDPESFADRCREILDILDNVAVLGDRHGNAGNIDLLEGILSEERQRHVAGDRNKRNTVHIRGRDTCYEIGGAGAARREADADFAGCPRIAVRHMGSALLVGRKIMGDLVSVFI